MVQPSSKRLITEANLNGRGYITAAEVQTIEGPQGPQGDPGPQGPPGTSATITGATATGLAAGASPTVTVGGTASERSFEFGIPAGAAGTPGAKGDTGDTGPAGTITSATASGLAAGASPTVTLGGTPSARTMAFGIPAGATGSAGTAATVGVESTITGAAGTSASVTNQGTSSAANFRFTIPRGDTGAAGTNGTNGTSADITGVSATGLAAGASPTATLGGTSLARTIAFGIPAGATGATGPAGTITGATATTLAAGSSATVTLGGTAEARTFAFGIPRGDTGASGSGGGLSMPRVIVSARWINTTITGNSMSTQAATASRLYLVPFVFSGNRSIDQVGCNVSTQLAGNVRMGIYNADATTGLPTTVLIDGGTASTGTTGGKAVAAVVTLTADTQYYTAIVCDAAATFTAGTAAEMWPIAGGASQSNVGANHGYATATATSALPNLTAVTITWATATIPMCSMRVA